MESPTISTTEFIQNGSPLASIHSPTSTTNNLVTHLKESLQLAQSELNQQIFENSELKIYKSKFEDLSNDYNILSGKFDSLESEKKFSDIEITNLRKETEELSSQLFSEANNMVSQARREAFDFKKSNDSLKNEISEKDNLIHILKSQLTDLKKMLQDQSVPTTADFSVDFENSNHDKSNIEIKFYPDDNITDTADGDVKQIASRNHSTGNLSISKPADGAGTSINSYSISNFIYAPTVQSLRYDIKGYHLFQEFGEKLYHDFKAGHHTSNSKTSYLEIKDHKFYRKLLNDDIEPTLRLDEAPGVAWLSKKNLITSMLIGKVSIEPISSINESYKTDVVLHSISDTNNTSKIDDEDSTAAASINEPPVAFEDPCSLCGENRNDTLDHSRLYVLKVIGTKTIKKRKDGTPPNQTAFSKFVSSNKDKENTITIVQEYIANQYPLCSYCLHRVRSVCELFAFLRGVKAGIWKFDTKLSCQKNWIECVRIRTKIFYSRIGVIESSNNLINNNSFTFTSSQLLGAESLGTNGFDRISNRTSGYFSNYGSRMSSPIMANFANFVNNNGNNGPTNSVSVTAGSETEVESSSNMKNGGLFSNRNSIINSFWGSSSSTNSSSTPAPEVVSPTTPKRKEKNMSVFNQTNSSFNSDKLEGKIDEVIVTTENGSPFRQAKESLTDKVDTEPVKMEIPPTIKLDPKNSEEPPALVSEIEKSPTADHSEEEENGSGNPQFLDLKLTSPAKSAGSEVESDTFVDADPNVVD
ncbi:guanine nucleotide exchange factor [Saccharomycopsis crataegensis]|uniref:Guanine nucleotide exchange factor n=1 Tax=Saccharomycopsis crataegensis TaxID=43959 RepID=A0AAV5QME5_9ASCO|nr:guanine nucleotide exchange factor [Saccharomycopsis crataegensis]